MHLLDWLIVAAYLLWVILDGVKRAKSTETFLGNGAYHRERLAQQLLDDGEAQA